MFAGSCIWGIISEYQKWNAKDGQKSPNIGEVWNPVCCHGNQTVKLVLWSTFSGIVAKNVSLLVSDALFLWRQEDSSSLHLLSDDRSGQQMSKNF